MRLICPSCGAQYEVDESVIPETGRDVQCSNCGHAWFQSPAETAAVEDAEVADESAAVTEVAEESAVAEVAEELPAVTEVAEESPAVAEVAEESAVVTEVAEESAAVAEESDAAASGNEVETASEEAEVEVTAVSGDASEDSAEAETEDASEPLDIVQRVEKALGRETPPVPEAAGSPDDTAGEPVQAAEEADTDDDEPLPVAPNPELRRRKLDDAVLGVLREEAERENRVRKVEEALESQPDLGLAAVTDFDEGKNRDRVVRVRGDEDDLDDDALTTRASRRELLPDIEQIKSTLTATSQRGDEPAAVDAPETLARRQRSGFRRGFMTALLLAFLAVLVYALAPAISAAVPALEPALTAYVDAVNSARIWLDTKMQSLTEALKASTGGQ